MIHKSLPQKPGRYPFERKTRWQTTGPRSLNSPASHPLAGKALCRFPHWDRSKPVKGHV